MGIESPSRVDAVFDNRSGADQAVLALRNAGFAEGSIHISEEPVQPETAYPGQEETLQAQNQAFFSWVGGVIFAIAGIVVVIALPATQLSLQPLPLAIVAGIAYAGYVLGGLIGRRFRFGYRIREHQELHGHSRVVVTVRTAERHAECKDILNRHGARSRTGPRS